MVMEKATLYFYSIYQSGNWFLENILQICPSCYAARCGHFRGMRYSNDLIASASVSHPPPKLTVQTAPGPQGEGSQGSRGEQRTRGLGSSSGNSGGHLQVTRPSCGMHMARSPHGFGSHGLGTIQPPRAPHPGTAGTRPSGHLHSGSPSYIAFHY